MMRRSMILVAILSAGFAGMALAADTAKGKAVFDGAKPACKMCHTATKNSLAKVGAENSLDELKAWVRTPKEQMAKKNKKGMMPAFGTDKISDADLDALVAYLATMK
jgi:mono/diheme cytochrome c family protein